MNPENQLTTSGPTQLSSWEDMERMAKNVADSKMFGISNAAQAMCLFSICQAEGLNPIMALRRYHLIEGRPSMRADAMLAEFIKAGGGVLWHVRTDDLVAATWFAKASGIDDEAKARGSKRFDLLWKLAFEDEPSKKSVLLNELSILARDGEETILRSYSDCESKGLTTDKNGDTKSNWKSSPRQMLTARNLTEGIRIVSPGLITGIYESDEVQQIIQQETRQPDWSHIGKQERLELSDRAAIEKMIEQHLKEAISTPNKARKSELYGLVSDLREKLAAMEPQKIAWEERDTSGDPKENYVEQDKPDRVELHAKSVDVVVLSPIEDDDQLPGIENTEPKLATWQDYKLQTIRAVTKPLSELAPVEIKTLHKNFAKKDLSTASAAVRKDASMIAMAFETLGGAK